MKYLKYFETEAGYASYKNGSDFITPNVSYAVDNNIVYYNPYVEKEKRVVCTYNVTDTVNSTMLCSKSSNFASMEVDGILLDSVATEYTFDTVGEHTVKFELVDPTVIVDYAFNSCSNLTSVTIPDSVTSINIATFQGCYNLTSIVIPDSVTSIGDYAFQGSGLTSVYIGSEGVSIGESAFSSCSKLTSVEIISGIVGARAFQWNYSNLTSVKIKAGSIGDGAFMSCTNLTLLELGEGVTKIGEESFVGCGGLTSIIIPDSVTSIGEHTFRGCYNLNEITCISLTAPGISSGTFESVKSGGILKVPTGSDYSSWMSTNSYYLGYYNWTVEYI